MNALNNDSHAQQIGRTPMSNLNEGHVSPTALLRPNDLLTRMHNRAGLGAVLRDERLQVATSPSGEILGRLIKSAA